MKTLLYSISFLFILIASTGQAQDQMFLIGSKNAIAVNIIEIGLDEIKYTPYSEENSPVLVVPKSLVAKIIMADGSKYEFADPMYDPAMYVGQKKIALKISFLSTFLGSTQFTFEKSVKPGQSWEATVGIIGLGFDPQEWNPLGTTLKFGWKFINSPNYKMRGMRYSHILKGGYIRPEIIMNFFSYDDYSDNGYYSPTPERSTSISGALVLNLGKQWIYSNSFLVDLYIGVGYGFSNSNYDSNYYYGFVGAFGGFPVALTGNLRIGWLIK